MNHRLLRAILREFTIRGVKLCLPSHLSSPEREKNCKVMAIGDLFTQIKTESRRVHEAAICINRTLMQLLIKELIIS